MVPIAVCCVTFASATVGNDVHNFFLKAWEWVMTRIPSWPMVIVAGVLAALGIGVALTATSPAQAAVKTIVLVHGAFADGSGWKAVTDILQSHGYSVRIVQEPETSFQA